MTVDVGDRAPPFELPAAPGETVRLRDELEAGPVVLLFIPLAYSRKCTEEMCAVRDGWSRWGALDARVLGVSVDSPFVTDRFRREHELPFPVLSDFNRDVIRRYGVVDEDMHGLRGVAKRSVFVVDTDGRLAYRWIADDPDRLPPLDAVMDALEDPRGGTHE